MADDDLVRTVYERSYRRLVAHCTALSGSRSEAEDVVQQAFLVAVTHRDDLAEATDKEAWLRAVALTQLRHRWFRARLVGRGRPRFRSEPSIDLGPGVPEEHAAVVYALSRLSLPVRVAVVLRHLDGRDVAEIARELGIPEGTVMARLARAHTEMAPHLSAFEEAARV
ncbi:RNA polymerase sigma factor [Intrasporangium sp. YIM S08009]|uniref:RNA polymerase sigma factor n=1 Tax=Intrasporangium zincisolvens TaxID=3080018 RepID=UPI002B053086|nr:sigma-70 family RNA polymerase sigma factor [Intrasporangium sp. YIM S08009]